MNAHTAFQKALRTALDRLPSGASGADVQAEVKHAAQSAGLALDALHPDAFDARAAAVLAKHHVTASDITRGLRAAALRETLVARGVDVSAPAQATRADALGEAFAAAYKGAHLKWDPSVLDGAQPLNDAGAVRGGPFADLSTALRTVSATRAAVPGETYLVVRGPRGWGVQAFNESRRGRVDLAELSVGGLPLGGSMDNPGTFVIDAAGRVGQLRPGGRGAYRLVEMALDQGALVPKTGAHPELRLGADTTLALKEPSAPEAFLPAVLPERQVTHGRNVTWNPRMAFRPGSDIRELSATMQHLQATRGGDVTIKAGGSRHAWSDAAASDDVYIHPEGMKFSEALLPAGAPGAMLAAHVTADEAKHLMRFGSGTTVREANQALWDAGLAFAGLGGYDGQTLGGVIPTGTHGSVLKNGPLADAVQSIDMVRPDGTMVRIEGSPGITDEDAFKAAHPHMELIQDDEVFNAARINVGTMGVVHSYTLKTVNAFHMREVRTGSTMRELKERLADGGIYRLMDHDTPGASLPGAATATFAGHPEGAYHMEFLFNAHGDNVTVASRQPVELDGAEPSTFTDRPERDLFKMLKTNDTWTRGDIPTWLSEHIPEIMGRTTTAISRHVPSLTPKVVDTAINAIRDGEYVDRSYNVFHIGMGQNHIPALSGTIYVPLRDDMYLEAMDVLQETAAAFAKKHNRYQNAPMSMRFVKGSDASLGNPEDVASFELIFSGDTEWADDMIAAYDTALRKAFGGDVRMHWGQMSRDVDQTRLKANYPKFEAFKKVRDAFDPDGVMLNDTQRALFR